MIRQWLWTAALLGTLLVMSGCTPSTYEPGYRYFPQPAVVDVLRRDSNRQAPLTVLASVIGVRLEDSKQFLPYSVEIRLRFENTGQSRVTFDPRSLELVTGTLRSFGPPVIHSPGAPEIAPSERRELTTYFPFPANTTASQMNMRNLRLRWEVTIEGVVVPQSAVFERVNDGSYEPADVPY